MHMRTVFALALAVILVGGAMADEIYVPDNNPTTGGSNVIPFSGPWPSSSNPNGEWCYQWWIPAAAMGGKSGLIKEIAVVSNSSGTLTAGTCEYAMGTNTLSTPSSTFATNLPNPTICYPAGPYTWTVTKDTWAPVGLKSGFYYNGKDNLVIQVRFKNSSMVGTSYFACYYDKTQPNAPHRIYKYGTGAYTATTGSGLGSTPNGLRVRLTMDTVTIAASGSTSLGGKVLLDLAAPGDAGLAYQAASSFGQGPIPIDSRQLDLNLDDLFVISVNGWVPGIFSGYVGLLDNAGKAQATMVVPNITALVGTRIYSAFVTIKVGEPSNIKTISPNVLVTITK
jgi:hypothetical protein